MNYLSLGTAPLELPKSKFLLIDDEVPKLADWKRPQYFDYRKHSINPLHNLDYRKICDLVDVFAALFVVTGGTLTESTGLEYIGEQLANHPASLADLIPLPDKKDPTGHQWAYGKVQRLMRSPVLRQVLTGKPNFTPTGTVLARLNRAELGEFDCTALALFLIAQWRGTVVIPDGGFYLRDTHTQIIRENRLVAGVRTLDDLPDKLRRRILLIEDKTIAGALWDDAVLLAKHAGLHPDPTREDNPYNQFIRDAMQPPEIQPQPELWSPPPLKERVAQPKSRKWKRRASSNYYA